MSKYSFVIPIHNEEGSISVLFEEIQSVMNSIGADYEVVFVNDGSTDSSDEIITQLSESNPGIISPVVLSERKGQTFAMNEGVKGSKGDFVITMDADLQNDPGDIVEMVKKMEEGYDCVCGWRKARQDTVLKAGLSKFGNILQRLISGLRIHDVSCTLRIYTRECANKIPLNWEGQHRFIPLCLSLQGFNIGEVVSNHRQRKFGYTKYSHKRIFRVMVDFFKILKAKGRK